MPKVKEQTVTYSPTKLQSPKKQMGLMLKKLDDDSSYDDIMYELYVMKKIEKGLKDIDEGKTYTHAQAKRELRKWLK